MDAQSDHDLLVRIDERTSGLNKTMSDILPTLVTRREFTPVKSIVYGFVGLILVAVLGGLISLVVRK